MSEQQVNDLFEKFEHLQSPDQFQSVFDESRSLTEGDRKVFAGKVQAVAVQILTGIMSAEGFSRAFMLVGTLAAMTPQQQKVVKMQMNAIPMNMNFARVVDQSAAFAVDVLGKEKCDPMIQAYADAVSETADEDYGTSFAFFEACVKVKNAVTPKPVNPFKKPAAPKP